MNEVKDQEGMEDLVTSQSLTSVVPVPESRLFLLPLDLKWIEYDAAINPSGSRTEPVYLKC